MAEGPTPLGEERPPVGSGGGQCTGWSGDGGCCGVMDGSGESGTEAGEWDRLAAMKPKR